MSGIKALVVFDGGDAPGYMAVATALTEEWTRRGGEVYAAREGFRSLTGDSIGNDTPLVRLVWREEEVHELRLRSVEAFALHRRIADPGCAFRSERFRGFSATDRIQRAAQFLLAGGFDRVVGVGGNGTFAGIRALDEIVGASAERSRPRLGFLNVSIDSDLLGDRSVGFATGLEEGARIARGLFEDAFTHGRIYLLEMMGNRSGKHALHAGAAARAHLVLLPGLDLDDAMIEEIAGGLASLRYALVVVAEGAEADRPKGLSAAEAVRRRLVEAGLADGENRRVIAEPFSRYLRGVRPCALDIEAAVLKAKILIEGLEHGAEGVMAFSTGEHDHGLRPFESVETDDSVESAYLELIDRIGLPLLRARVSERFRGVCPWPGESHGRVPPGPFSTAAESDLAR